MKRILIKADKAAKMKLFSSSSFPITNRVPKMTKSAISMSPGIESNFAYLPC